MRQYLQEIQIRKDLLVYLVQSGLKAENRNSYLGYFWWLLDPLLNVLVYYFLVGVLLDRGGYNFAVFLVIGLVAWRWINTTVNGSAKAILKYSSIINQVYLPKAIFPMTITSTQLINFAFGLIIIASFLIATGTVPGWQVIFLPVIILIQYVFLLAISLFLAYVAVFIRDVDNILSHVTRVFFYASPIIWEGGRLGPAAEDNVWIDILVTVNPIAHIVTGYRDILMEQSMPEWTGLLLIGFFSILAIVILIYYYSRNEHKIIKAL